MSFFLCYCLIVNVIFPLADCVTFRSTLFPFLLDRFYFLPALSLPLPLLCPALSLLERNLRPKIMRVVLLANGNVVGDIENCTSSCPSLLRRPKRGK